MEEKILTRHPKGKDGINISRSKYEILRGVIFRILKGKELTQAQLMELVNEILKGKFQGSISKYAKATLLDLEARNIIKRIYSTPQKYALN
jgi:hypothetical protein